MKVNFNKWNCDSDGIEIVDDVLVIDNINNSEKVIVNYSDLVFSDLKERKRQYL